MCGSGVVVGEMVSSLVCGTGFPVGDPLTFFPMDGDSFRRHRRVPGARRNTSFAQYALAC